MERVENEQIQDKKAVYSSHGGYDECATSVFAWVSEKNCDAALSAVLGDESIGWGITGDFAEGLGCHCWNDGYYCDPQNAGFLDTSAVTEDAAQPMDPRIWACVNLSDHHLCKISRELVRNGKTMKKADIGEFLCEIIEGITKSESLEFVDTAFDELKKSIARDGKTTITGFGSFALKHKRERLGTNPKTGEKMVIEAQATVKFKPSKCLKEVLNQQMSTIKLTTNPKPLEPETSPRLSK